jgi:hypothetical protein
VVARRGLAATGLLTLIAVLLIQAWAVGQLFGTLLDKVLVKRDSDNEGGLRCLFKPVAGTLRVEFS